MKFYIGCKEFDRCSESGIRQKNGWHIINIAEHVMKGPMHDDIEKELLKHADEELDHAKLLIDRIIQLDGTQFCRLKNGLN